MKQALLSFLKSKTFKALVAVIATALTAWASQGCGVFPEPKSPEYRVFECRVQVLAPFVGDAAGQVAVAVAAGQTDPVQLLLSLGLTPDQIVKVANDYHACKRAPEPVKAPADAGLIEG